MITEEKFVEELEHLLERAGKGEMFTMIVRTEGKWALYSSFATETKSRILLTRFLEATEGMDSSCRN